jgi:two-component system sensor histidine kinase PilS (NtrC family)
VHPAAELAPAPEDSAPVGSSAAVDDAGESRSRLLTLLNGYRLLCGVLTLLIALFAQSGIFALYDARFFYVLCPLYLAYAAAALLVTKAFALPLPRLSLLLLIGDLVFMAGFTYASGGTGSGIGMLLFPWLAGYGWLLRDRTALLHAALAAIALLGLEVFWWLHFGGSTAQFLPAGLLGVGYFATTGLGLLLGRYSYVSEKLAVQRGIDLANLAQVNQRVIQDMQDGVVVVDGTATVRAFNTQAERFLGQYGKKTTGVPLTEFALPLSDCWQAWVNHTTEDPPPLALAGKLLRVRFVPVGTHRVDGALIYLEDMGRAHAQAQQIKLAALGRLTANIAHEIRNPLSAVNHATELLLEESALPVNARKLLGIVHTNSGRIDRIVREVLELNRRDRRQAEIFELAPTVHSMVDEIVAAEHIPPECIRVLIAGQPEIRFDRGHFGQVLWNLLRNAWQHCRREKDSIELSVRPGYSPFHVLFEIADDGPGVPATVRPQLFEPFFTTHAGGTGLGLYVARQLCEANGATLDLVDTSHGGHFRVVALSGAST